MKNPENINILIACEESQTICKAFREFGFNAYSNDIQECSGGRPEWHLQMDCFEAIKLKKWDLMIAHPPCTYLSYAGIRWFNIEKYGEKAILRHKLKDEAIEFFIKIWNSDIPKICMENPRGFIQMVIKPTQIIHPYFFGDPFKKTTLLWLKELPTLYHNKDINLFDKNITHTNKGETYYRITKDGKKKLDTKWYCDAIHLPAAERQKFRSKTFQGIANAMAEQWGQYLLNNNCE